MDNKKQSVHYKKCMFRESKEHQLESQLNLPDYYPDVCRILSCKVSTYVENCYADSDRINADGIAVIRLLYCAQDKTLHLFETEQRFTKAVILQKAIQSPIVSCCYQTENVHYRAVGPRRIDIRTYIKLSADVSVVAEVSCSTSLPDGIEKLIRSYDLFDISSCCSEMFTINEDFSLRDERIKESKILDSTARILTTDIKCVQDKILIKGNAELDVLYLCSEEQILFKYSESIPFSQIIDLYGLKETDKTFVCLRAQQPVLTIKDSGECEFSLRVKADITAGESITAYVMEDIFGSSCEVSMTLENEAPHKNVRAYRDSFSVTSDHEKTEYSELQILSLYSENPVFNADITQEKMTVNGHVKINIFAQTEDGIVSFSRNIPFEYVREVDSCSNADINLQVSCTAVTCNATMNGIQIKAELELVGYSILNESISFVSSYSVDAIEQRHEFDTVTLYFAEPGESIWEIAKLNRVSLQSLKMNNDLSGDFIEDEKVLILLHSEAVI